MTATPFKRRILDLIRVIWGGYRTSWGYKADKEDEEFERVIFGEGKSWSEPDDYTIPQLANIFTLLARKAGYKEKEITSLWKTGSISQNPVRQGSWGAKPFTSTRQGIPRKPPLIAGGEGNAPGSLYVALSYLSEELERLKKNRDEMLEDFSIRKRPNHPFDFVVIVKHRSYIEGRRLYSAALKTKSRIEDSIWPFGGKIIGWRQKEKGGSDYTYEIYGIRYSKDRPNFQGKKLFDNLRANPSRMPTTAAQERAEKIARMRKEGLEPLPYGLEKATIRQLQMLGHGDSIWSKKWGMRVKRVR